MKKLRIMTLILTLGLFFSMLTFGILLFSHQNSGKNKPNGNDGINIVIPMTYRVEDIDPETNISKIITAVDVQIENIGDKTVEFDKIRVLFYDRNRFVSGVTCVKLVETTKGFNCIHSEDENYGAKPDGQAKVVSIKPGKGVKLSKIPCRKYFDIFLSTTQNIVVSIYLEDILLVEKLHKY